MQAQVDPHGDVQEAELTHGHEQPDRRQHPPRHLRARHQEDRREHHGDEAQRQEDQRRHVAHPEIDGQEVQAPQGRHEGGQGVVSAAHGSSLGHGIVQHQRLLLGHTVKRCCMVLR